ncbi:MAG TPA: hypothetical protein ENK85_01515 [Saprospiraceae bacterium]|nr:hypothetical protein [Saprospiraceae bacterium]
MRNFINLLKRKESAVSSLFIKKEMKRFEKIMHDLEEEHHAIKSDLSKINDLLALIEKHETEEVPAPKTHQNKGVLRHWLESLEEKFEKLHLQASEDLTEDDWATIQQERAKLLFEKERLEKEHKQLHELIAKTGNLLMEARETACFELTKGHSISSVGEKLLEHFGKKVDVLDYEIGRHEIIKFLREKFQLNRIEAKALFDILEKSRILKYELQLFNGGVIQEIDTYDGGFVADAIPVGKWIINA